MKRQNKDGRPIYRDKTWDKMVETGKKLEKLGYRESRTKPNLFFKSISIDDKSKEGQNIKVKGAVFADIRGTEIVPIWDDPRPLVYPSGDLPFKRFVQEFILFNRMGCDPRVSFYEECEPDGWMFGLDEAPTGFCKRCGEDILHQINWEILREDFFNLYEKGIDQNIEVSYCDTCRYMEYNLKNYRLQNSQDFNLCELCGNKEAKVDHHITYAPENIIRLCHSCHGKVHSRDFPNPLWKQKRKDLLEINDEK